MKNIAGRIDKLMGRAVEVGLDIEDKLVGDMVDDLYKAKVRLELTQKGFGITFPQVGSRVIKFYRVLPTRTPKERLAAKISKRDGLIKEMEEERAKVMRTVVSIGIKYSPLIHAIQMEIGEMEKAMGIGRWKR